MVVRGMSDGFSRLFSVLMGLQCFWLSGVGFGMQGLASFGGVHVTARRTAWSRVDGLVFVIFRSMLSICATMTFMRTFAAVLPNVVLAVLLRRFPCGALLSFVGILPLHVPHSPTVVQ